MFIKSRRESMSDQVTGAFNPSKTFGGEKARMMFPLKDFDDSQQQTKPQYSFSKDFSKEKEEPHSGITTQDILPALENLFKRFKDNEMRLERIGMQPQKRG